MSFAKVHSAAVLGMDAYKVEVEVDTSLGLPTFDLIGLDSALREAKERVRAALKIQAASCPPGVLPSIWPRQTGKRKVQPLTCPLLWVSLSLRNK